MKKIIDTEKDIFTLEEEMTKFENISSKPGFMKHNGGLLFKTISKSKYQFKTKVKKIHLNRAGITHGGFLAGILDAGSGTAVGSGTTSGCDSSTGIFTEND